MNELIQQFHPITLDEMKSIRLMNRMDTKFVTTRQKLLSLLDMALQDYRIQEINGERNMEYDTTYFDTRQFDMYYDHQYGHSNRQKIRFRTYVSSDSTPGSLICIMTTSTVIPIARRYVSVLM